MACIVCEAAGHRLTRAGTKGCAPALPGCGMLGSQHRGGQPTASQHADVNCYACLCYAGGAGGISQLPGRVHLQSGCHRCPAGCRSASPWCTPLLPQLPDMRCLGSAHTCCTAAAFSLPCTLLLFAAPPARLRPDLPAPLPCACSARVALHALPAPHARADLHLHDLWPGRAARVQGLGLAGLRAGRGALGRCVAWRLLSLGFVCSCWQACCLRLLVWPQQTAF